LRCAQIWSSNNGKSSHADVIDPSRTIRKDNDIKVLDQLIGCSTPASDAEKFSI